MSYEEFKTELFRNIMQQDEVKGKLVRLLEKGFTSKNRQMQDVVIGINLTSFGREDTALIDDVIHVTWGEGSIVSMLHWSVREYYDKYKKEGWPGVLPEIFVRLQKTNQGAGRVQSKEESYEQIKNRLVIRPINYDRNKFELEDSIYWRFGDIALTLYNVVYENEEEYVTMKISREFSAGWGIADDSILTNALLNSVVQMPPRLYYATDLRRKHVFCEGSFMPDEVGQGIKVHTENKLEGTLGYRLTTARSLNGAVAIFYPGVRECLAELMEGDYFVGFTSIHEAVIHPVTHQSAVDIQDSIRSINAVFPIEEMLTNRVYRYCTERRELIEI